MILPPVNTPEYWIIIWIAIELAILTFFIRRNVTRQIDPRTLSAVGLSLVVFGTFFYLVLAIPLFSINDYETICLYSILSSENLIEEIEGKLIEDKLWTCYNQTNDTKWNLFIVSVMASMVIVFGTILQAASRRN